ncbi:MAG: pantoate--beta-alanine ligase [Pseudomonadales bacterium]
MRQISRLDEFRKARHDFAAKTVGFVPTMGALHPGHAELIKASVAENDVTVLSIYVNQTQFNNPQDLQNYPDLLAEDLALAESLGVDLVLTPDYEQMYPDGYRYQVDENQFSQTLCGEHRPGHFTGVLTVVMKLLNIVRPDKAYFGEKDCQQLKLIEGMVDAFFMDVAIRAVPTVREADGLAMSSRNLNLTPEERQIAPALQAVISSDLSDLEAQESLEAKGFVVDYLQTIDGRRFAAATLGKVRLIDNVEVSV